MASLGDNGKIKSAWDLAGLREQAYPFLHLILRSVPQFSSNLLYGSWAAVLNYTNTFADATNVTTFDRLDPICGPNVFLRISQQPPNRAIKRISPNA